MPKVAVTVSVTNCLTTWVRRLLVLKEERQTITCHNVTSRLLRVRSRHLCILIMRQLFETTECWCDQCRSRSAYLTEYKISSPKGEENSFTHLCCCSTSEKFAHCPLLHVFSEKYILAIRVASAAQWEGFQWWFSGKLYLAKGRYQVISQNR